MEVRDDEEQTERLQDSLDLLVAAGYFRARVKGLEPFDKIVGGLVWCISTCNFSVDVDLLFSENSTIGQKIALTEKIVDVLPRMKCPHNIEPHQIQGLDYINIYPVIQWLVKRVLEVKELYGDRQKAYVNYLYDHGTRQQQTSTDVSKEEGVAVRLLEQRQSSLGTRRFRRKSGCEFTDLRQEIACTLAEYVPRETLDENEPHNAENEQEVPLERSELETVSRRSRTTGAALRGLIDEEQIGHLREITQLQPTTSSSESKLNELNEKIEQAALENSTIDTEINNMREKVATLQEQVDRGQRKLDRLKELEAALEPSELEARREIFSTYLAVRTRESEYKKKCKAELAELDKQIEELKQQNQGNQSEKPAQSALEAEVEDLRRQLDELKHESAELSQQVVRRQRELDSVPSQIEVAQYHKRLIELYNQMGTKHRVTRQFYNQYNALVDTLAYLKKEVTMLNSIEDVLHLATREENRDSFLQQMTAIHRGIEQNLEKFEKREKEAELQRDELFTELQYLEEKDRTFRNKTEEFAKACEYNEMLRAKLAALGYTE